MLLNKLLSSIIEITLLSIIPFIWWLLTYRKKKKLLILDRLKTNLSLNYAKRFEVVSADDIGISFSFISVIIYGKKY